MILARLNHNSQITIPVKLRREFEIGPGDYVGFEMDTESGEIRMKIVQAPDTEDER